MASVISQESGYELAYAFAGFRYDPGEGLSQGGKAIPLPPKEGALLELLLRFDGAVASREDIQRNVWPRQSVSYASVARCVHALRNAFGAAGASIISTVPKRGYKLSAPVTRLSKKSRITTLGKAGSAQAAAQSNYLEAWREANRGSDISQLRALELFAAAAEIDLSFALPLAGIADCTIYRVIRGYQVPAEALELIVRSVESALARDSDLAPAHAVLGWVQALMQGQLQLGLASLATAELLDPTYSRTFSYLAWVFRAAGRLNDSVVAARKAAELDPHSLLNRHALAWTLFCAGEADEALHIEQLMRSERPYDELAHAYTAIISAWLGIDDEAVRAGRDAMEQSGGNPAILTALSYALACSGSAREAHELAARINLDAPPRAPRAHLAMTYVALGEAETALELLRQARSEACPWFPAARFDPRIGSLQDDARLHALYQRD